MTCQEDLRDDKDASDDMHIAHITCFEPCGCVWKGARSLAATAKRFAFRMPGPPRLHWKHRHLRKDKQDL